MGRVGPRTVALGLSTRRAAVLAVVVCALALALAVPLRTYVAQRQELADTAATQAQLTAEVGELQARLDQLDDPAYVAAQARERLRYVRAGETPYRVQLPAGVGVDPEPVAADAAPSDPWYTTLWGSIAEPEPAAEPGPTDVEPAAGP